MNGLGLYLKVLKEKTEETVDYTYNCFYWPIGVLCDSFGKGCGG